ncbi:hypothetical protein PG994_010995, partial [Apiospora phragmitis]
HIPGGKHIDDRAHVAHAALRRRPAADPPPQGGGAAVRDPGQLDWAFAGTSSHDAAASPPHSVFRHWVDSRHEDAVAVVDEGDMVPSPRPGETLESGRMVNPATGLVQPYEECWLDEEPGEGAASEGWVLRYQQDDEQQGEGKGQGQGQGQGRHGQNRAAGPRGPEGGGRGRGRTVGGRPRRVVVVDGDCRDWKPGKHGGSLRGYPQPRRLGRRYGPRMVGNGFAWRAGKTCGVFAYVLATVGKARELVLCLTGASLMS